MNECYTLTEIASKKIVDPTPGNVSEYLRTEFPHEDPTRTFTRVAEGADFDLYRDGDVYLLFSSIEPVMGQWDDLPSDYPEVAKSLSRATYYVFQELDGSWHYDRKLDNNYLDARGPAFRTRDEAVSAIEELHEVWGDGSRPEII